MGIILEPEILTVVWKVCLKYCELDSLKTKVPGEKRIKIKG